MIPFYLISNMASIKHLPSVQTFPRHMVLAQVIQKDPDAFRILRHMRTQYKARIILDNGAYEGEMLDDDTLLSIAQQLRPAVLVLPDLLGVGAIVSRERSMKFAARVRALSSTWAQKVDLMYVPQGASAEDNFQEYKWAIDELPSEEYIIGLGLSYKLWKEPSDDPNSEITRARLVVQLMRHAQAPQARFHVLGARWRGTRGYSAFPCITGIDTFKPMRCTLMREVYPGSSITQALKGSHTEEVIADGAILRDNLRIFAREWGAYIGDQTNPHPARIKEIE